VPGGWVGDAIAADAHEAGRVDSEGVGAVARHPGHAVDGAAATELDRAAGGIPGHATDGSDGGAAELIGEGPGGLAGGAEQQVEDAGSDNLGPGGAADERRGVVIGVSLRRVAHPRELLGISGAGSRLGAAVVLGIGSGVAAGFWQRGQASVPHEAATGLPLFVLLACLIGIAEELVYRGWMQGRLSSLGWPAVVVAAVAHAAYKTALFAWPPEAVTSVFDLGSIALWTVLGGLMLGGLRVMSGSVLPAMLAHAVFDAVVYSGYAAAPWWVWR